MKINTSLTNVIGMKGFINDGQTVIMAWLLHPEEEKQQNMKKLDEPRTFPVRWNDTTVGSYNFSNMSVEKERKHPNVKGIEQLMISNIASSKTGNVFKQYFLLKRYDENGDIRDKQELVEEIKKTFFEKHMKSLPIPIKKDWEEYFWEEIEKTLHLLERKGNVPMEAYVLSLPDLTFLEKLIEKCHAKAEFKRYHKNVPSIDVLLTIANIQGFDIQGWKSFFTDVIKGKEALEKYTPEKQATLVRGFELFGDTRLVKDNLEIIHSASLKPIAIDIRLMGKDKNKKQQYKAALRKIIDEFSGKKSDLISILNNFADLFKEHQQNIKNGNWEAIEKYLATIIYDNVSEGCRDLAIVCGKAQVSKQQYPRYEEEYLETLNKCLTAPKEYPTISGEIEGSKVSWEVIDMSEPRAWVVGLETQCCQHLGSVGGACVLYAARNPSTSGIFRVDEKGHTIAQSFFWMQESSKKGEYILVFDNIEVKGGSIRGSVLDAYRSFAQEMEKYANLFRIRAITIGTGYLEGFLLDLAPKTAKGDDYAQKPATLGYYDASTQKLFKTFKLKKPEEIKIKPAKKGKKEEK